MADKSYLVASLTEWATFKDPSWASFIIQEIVDLEATKEKYFKECQKADKLKTEVEQLKAYVDILERQLSLASRIIGKTKKMKFPIYTERRRGCKNGG
jgi:hypothetical protein